MPLLINVKVIPRAHKQAIVLDQSGTIKIYLISAAEKGRANKELIKLLAERGKFCKSDIVIISGITTRLKRIKIMTNLTQEQFLTIIGLEVEDASLSMDRN